jgi:signal transduction histidine kinase
VSAPADADRLRRLHHDLRSPLVVIGGFAQLLASERPIPEGDRRDYAERIRRAADELQQLVDGALASR